MVPPTLEAGSRLSSLHMEKAKINIRYATAADHVLLAELGARTFYDTLAADNTPENMAAYLAASFGPEIQAAELSAPGSLFLIAEVDGAAVGYTRLREGQPSARTIGVRPLEIVRLYARQEWLGQGVGAALMKASLDEAARRGCDSIWLDVWDHNLRARAFYSRWGFAEMGTQSFQLGDDLQNDLLMQATGSRTARALNRCQRRTAPVDMQRAGRSNRRSTNTRCYVTKSSGRSYGKLFRYR